MAGGVDPINNINSLDPIKRIQKLNREKTEKAGEAAGKTEPDFQKVLDQAIQEVNSQRKASTQARNDFAAGKISNIHDVIITAEKAGISLRMTMEIRNKIVDSYKEIMRMQL